MSTSDLHDEPNANEAAETAKPPLKLDMKVESPQSCLRHVVVTIPQAEVQRYMQDAYDELVPEAQVPGFRPGRAPRKLVEKQFRERVANQVKGSLLMDSLSQVTDSAEFSAISEPDFDYDSIDLPDDGDFRFEFTVEVRPEFETPEWKGLSLSRPVEEISDQDVETALDGLLARYGTVEATDQPAELGDELLLTARFLDNGKVLSEMDEERVTLKAALSLSDARCDDFGQLLTGVREGETRTGKVTIGDHVDDESRRGKQVDAEFSVIEVFHRARPELTDAFLRELGDFESADELRQFVRSSLERQAQYRQRQALRKQVTELLTGEAKFDLPPDLVRRQTRRELERKILELRRSGFDEDSIRRYVNATKQNAQAATEAALREHFILEQIAEEQKVDADEADYEAEIDLIAEQSDQPARRVRARLEKSGQMDALRNQIVERKVVDMITEQANVSDQPLKKDQASKDSEDEFALYHAVLHTHDADALPAAKYDDTPSKEDEKKTGAS